MNILIINGPNLNMLGIREPEIYGKQTYQALESFLKTQANALGIEAEILQTNHEGVIVDKIQAAYYNKTDAIIINPGAFTHYSYAIRDAIKAVGLPTVEVHLSDVNHREEFRKISVIADVCVARFIGHGFDGYRQALEFLKEEKHGTCKKS
jgi:3-dehydroquinate dehydratase type II